MATDDSGPIILAAAREEDLRDEVATLRAQIVLEAAAKAQARADLDKCREEMGEVRFKLDCARMERDRLRAVLEQVGIMAARIESESRDINNRVLAALRARAGIDETGSPVVISAEQADNMRTLLQTRVVESPDPNPMAVIGPSGDSVK